MKELRINQIQDAQWMAVQVGNLMASKTDRELIARGIRAFIEDQIQEPDYAKILSELPVQVVEHVGRRVRNTRIQPQALYGAIREAVDLLVGKYMPKDGEP